MIRVVKRIIFALKRNRECKSVNSKIHFSFEIVFKGFYNKTFKRLTSEVLMKMTKGIVALSFAVMCSIAPTTPTQGTILFSSDLESEDSTAWSKAAASESTVNGWQLSEAEAQLLEYHRQKPIQEKNP